ncbi:MAG: DoxX family protein [Candidatus Paceibacterota bacterium]
MTQHFVFKESPVSLFLFANTKMAPLWLAVRLYVGYAWLMAGWSKLHSESWVGAEAGSSLASFLTRALEKTSGSHPDVAMWYADFLQNVVLPQVVIWAHVIAWGEFLVGAALILGLFTGIAAFWGLFMNFNFMLAGTLSSNPILFTLGILLVLAWRVAGFWGLDRYILPRLGTPWQTGTLFK